MIEKYKLDNGITVICDKLDFFKSFVMSFWIKVGSIYENSKTNGYSHFLEHMLFKGTKKRSYLDISKQIDSAGGYINAFTEKEHTCFHLHLIKHHLDLGIDLLSDMINNSLIDKNELDKEKKVVLEEIYMSEDMPDEIIYDLFFKHFWGTHPLSYSVLGKADNIINLSRDSLYNFYEDFYFSENLIISISGNFDSNYLLKKLNSLSFKFKDKKNNSLAQAFPKKGSKYLIKSLEQVYFILGFPTFFSRYSDERFAIHLLNQILSGGSSSRLFVEIREKKGLAYSIDSFNSLNNSNGVFFISSSSSLENYPILLETIKKELQKLQNHKIRSDELKQAKEQVKGALVFSQENLESRMHRQAKSEIYYNENIDYQKFINQIENVTLQDMNKLIQKIIQLENSSFYSIGPEKHIEYKYI